MSVNRDALRPENYGKEVTLVAAIPTKVENYKVKYIAFNI